MSLSTCYYGIMGSLLGNFCEQSNNLGILSTNLLWPTTKVNSIFRPSEVGKVNRVAKCLVKLKTRHTHSPVSGMADDDQVSYEMLPVTCWSGDPMISAPESADIDLLQPAAASSSTLGVCSTSFSIGLSSLNSWHDSSASSTGCCCCCCSCSVSICLTSPPSDINGFFSGSLMETWLDIFVHKSKHYLKKLKESRLCFYQKLVKSDEIWKYDKNITKMKR